MKGIWKRVIALMLTLILLVQSAPMDVLAEELKEAETDVAVEALTESTTTEEDLTETTAESIATETTEKTTEEATDVPSIVTFSATEDFTYAELNGSYIKITGYTGTATEVVIPSAIGEYYVQEIGDSAFKDNTAITSVVIPEDVKVIGASAFSGCTSLETVEWKTGGITLKSSAFAGCTSLTDVDLPDTITTIYAYAFDACTSLTSMVLPDSITTIGYRIFRNCTALTEVNYPKKWVNSPGGNGGPNYDYGEIFYGCTNITKITIPEDVEAIAPYAFRNCTQITEVELPEGLITIGVQSFKGCTGLTSLSLPASLDQINASAFSGCTGLTDVDFPEGLLTIYAYAFSGCTGLTELELPSSITTLGYRVFENCTSLSNVTYPTGWTDTPGGNGGPNYDYGSIFYGCTSLTSLTIPEGVTQIPAYAFKNCIYLKSVVLPESLTLIDAYAFSGCSGLRSITVPANVTQINAGAFGDCTGLRKITLPEGLKTIYAYAFARCTGLKEITLPDSIETMGYQVFLDCSNLTSVNYPLNLTKLPAGNGGPNYDYGTLFAGCTKLTSIVIPEGVNAIPANAFKNSTGFINIVVPDTVTSVGKNAFDGCSNLERIWLGANISSIGANAFSSCSNLTIHGVSGSYVETYASENSLTFTTESMAQEKEILTGSVKDENDAGIEGVSVNIFDVKRLKDIATVKTDADGVWKYEKAIADRNYVVRFQHPQYRIENERVECQAVSGSLTLDDVIAVKVIEDTETEAEENFTYTTLNGSFISITGYTGNSANLVIPSTIGDYEVQRIAASAFEGNTILETVVIPETVTVVESEAFSGCTSLKAVGFSEGTVTIQASAFKGCTALSDVSLPSSLTTIYAYAFSGCTSLTRIQMPDNIRTLGYRIFANCTNLETVAYPMGWENSPGGNGGPSYDYGEIFYGCSKLTSITIPEGTKVIPPHAFANCTYLTEVIWPSTVTTIGSNAFEGCTGLTAIALPENVKQINSSAFAGCSNVTNVSLPEGLTTIYAYAFKGCTGLTSLELPNSITTMGYRVFDSCTNLETINYPTSWANTPGGNGGPNYDYGGIFYGCTKLTSIEIPEGVTKIPDYAFENCTYLKNIVMPESLTTIGRNAFNGCTGVTSITVPAAVTSIGAYAFSNCTGLTKVNLPEGLTTIYAYAFSNCTGLLEITLPDTITTMGYRVFGNCSNLKNVNYPINLTSLPGGNGGPNYDYGGIFYGCSKLTSIIIPEGVTALPNYVFQSCTGFTSMALPDSVTSIGKYSFDGCTGLERIWIGEQVTTIGENAFKNCTSLTIHGVEGSYAQTYATEQGITFTTEPLEQEKEEICGYVKNADGNGILGVSASIYDTKTGKIIESVVTDETGLWSYKKCIAGRDYVVHFSHPRYSFEPQRMELTAVVGTLDAENVVATELIAEQDAEDASLFTYSTINGSYISITGYSGSAANLIIPSKIDDYVVQKIGAAVFKGNTTLESVVIPGTVTVIENNAFNGCTNLKTVGMENGVTTIGYHAFSGCTSLANVMLPGSLETIYAYAFSGDTALEKIVLPDRISTIGYRIFNGCTNLKEANYPIGWTSSPGGNGGPTYDYGEIFYGCSSLTSIVIPEGTASVAPYAFANCTYLTDIQLPESLERIGSHAFSGCTGLTALDLPDGLTQIDSSAYADCTNITDIQLPEGLTTIYAYAFSGCTGLTQIVLPDSITTMGYRVFQNCTNIEQATYPKGWVNTPGGNGGPNYDYGSIFYGCTKLTSIEIPDGVTAVPAYAFKNCANLTEIILPESLTDIGSAAFSGTGIEAIVLPESVEVIRSSAFSDCKSLKNISWPENLKTIYAYAFSGCTALTKVEMPDSIETMGYRVFQNCTELKEANYPKNWMNTPGGNGGPNYDYGGIFYGCNKLRTYTIPEGVTRIPNYAFKDCTYLRYVNLPESLTEIGAHAFSGCIGLPKIALTEGLKTISEGAFRYCDGLIQVSVPYSVETIGKNAFADCENLKNVYLLENLTSIQESAFSNSLVCLNVVLNSYAAAWAIEQGMNLRFVEGSEKGKENSVFDSDHTRFYTNSDTMIINNSMPLYLEYKLKDEKKDSLSNMSISIQFTPNLTYLADSLKVNGALQKSVDYENNVLTIPITEAEGRITLSMKPVKQGTFAAYTKLNYKENSTAKQEMFGMIYLDVPALAVYAPETTGTKAVKVTGITGSGEAVDLYVDDEKATTVYAKKDGTYAATLTLASAPVNGQKYKITATNVSDAASTISTTVEYREDIPILTEFKMYYRAHESKVLDLMQVADKRTNLYFEPGEPLTFRIQFDNADKIDELYVTSTKNGVTKYMEASRVGTTNEFVATGNFDENSMYVPGNISLSYYKKPAPEYSFDQELDTDDETLFGDIPEAVKNAEVTDVKTETTANGTVSTMNVRLADEDQTEFTVTQTSVKANYTESYLVSNGYTKVTDASGSVKYVKIEMTRDSVKELVYDAYSGEFVTMSIDMVVTDGGTILSGLGITTELLGDAMHIAQLKHQIANSNMSESEKQQAYEELDTLSEYYAVKAVVSYGFFAAGIIAGITFPASLVMVGAQIVVQELVADYYEGKLTGDFGNLFFDIIGVGLFGFNGINIKWLIDPSGYAYEAVTANRIAGVKVTAWYSASLDENGEGIDPVIWDATEYSQENPLYTNEEGVYAWDSPEGYWQVVAEKDGYITWTSEWIPVPPVQDQVNPEMISTAAPEVEWVKVDKTYVQVKFTKYLDPATVSGITLKDNAGNALKYTLSYNKNETSADGVVYADTYTFTFSGQSLNYGDTCTINIPATVKSYAGTSFAATTMNGECKEPLKASVPADTKVEYEKNMTVTVSFNSAVAKDDLIVESEFEDLVKVIDYETTDGGKTWKITLEGSLVGATNIKISVKGTDLVVNVPVEIVMEHVHIWDEGTLKTAATCAAKGVMLYRCSDCGEQKEETTKKDPNAHSFGAYVTTKAPTTEAEGEMTRTCSRCGATEKKAIDKLPASDTPPVVDTPPATDDSTGNDQTVEMPAVNTTLNDPVTKASYVVVEAGKSVEYKAPDNKNVTAITIPATVTIGDVVYNVTSVGNAAFKGNRKVKTVKLGKNITVIGNDAFSGCTNLQKVTGGTKVTSIGSKAFYKCTKLKSFGSKNNRITLPKIKTIGASAFEGCKVISYMNITSKGLTTIGKRAFYNCKKLSTIVFKTTKLTAKKVGAKAFGKIKANCTFKVPKAKIKIYKKLFQSKGAGKKIKVKK